MATKTRSKTRRKPSRSKKPARAKRSVKRRQLDQRTLDLIGLGLAALSVYMIFLLYLGGEGGRLGEGLREGLLLGLGVGAFLLPLGLLAAAAVLVFAPDTSVDRPAKTGAVVLALGLLLVLAAGIPGGRDGSDGYFDASWYRGHGGIVGDGLHWGFAQLLMPAGAVIVGLAAISAGVLMATGWTVNGILARLGRVGGGLANAAGDATLSLGGLGRFGRQRPASEASDVETELRQIEEGEEEVTVGLWADDPDDAPTELVEDEDPGMTVSQEERETAEVLLPEIEPSDIPEGQPVEVPQTGLTPMGETRGATVSSGASFRVPPAKVLGKGRKGAGPSSGEQKELARKLVETLGHFGVEASLIGVVTGPHVSRYELELAPGTKVKKVTELSNDLAYALASTEIRILAPIPGKQAVGVEVPNASRKMVRLGEVYSRPPDGSSPLLASLGRGIDGKAVSADLAAMPHILVAGTTGSGKSGCVNAILSSLLMHSSPNELRLVLVDPKQVELNHYENVPHLLTPVVTSPKLAANVLSNLLAEMETRYGLMKAARARNIADYNAHQDAEGGPRLPHILCVIDELADLMMVSPAEVESAIIRLAQKSRATGIHLVLATQRPSTDIITGTIKVNIPSRIAFAVSSQTDSRVILDQGGAESLLGQGDMLFRAPGTSKLQRIQGAFVSEEEIARITNHWAAQGEPEFHEELLADKGPLANGDGDEEFDPDSDELLDDAIRLVVETGSASVSMVQRRLRVGYTRAGRLIDMLERRGVISGYEGSKARQVLIEEASLDDFLSGGAVGGTSDAVAVGADAGESPAAEDIPGPGDPSAD
ncbi:MAG: DNA translocase FtsK 4TM domain-containing protein [Solirubrobacterales bacterium]